MKIAIVSNHIPTLLRFRGDLMSALVEMGHEVLAMVPPDFPDLVGELEKLGVTFVPYPLDRTTTNPFEDWKSFLTLKKEMGRSRPEVVLCYTTKPMIYGSFAASRAGANRIVSLVSGLGYGFTRTGMKQRILSFIQRALYRRAFRCNRWVVFQNPDDRALFEEWKLVEKHQSAVVAGSGVRLDDFPFHPVPSMGSFTFVMVARLLKEKGVLEYLEAARRVESELPGSCRFLLVGGEDENPGGLTLESLAKIESPVEFLGQQSEVKPFLEQSHCFVLPSYREGTPRSTLEALATGRPVVTTDAVGCRETVDHGVNGWLVEVGNPEALAEAMIEVASLSRERLEDYSKASRRRAEDIFDVRKVNEKMISFLLDGTSQ